MMDRQLQRNKLPLLHVKVEDYLRERYQSQAELAKMMLPVGSKRHLDRDDSCVVPEPVKDTYPCPDDTQTSQEVPQSGNQSASDNIDLRISSSLKKLCMLYTSTSETYKPMQ